MSFDDELLDALKTIDELGGKMAMENCPVAHVLLERGFVKEGPYDSLFRKTIKMTSRGARVLRPKSYDITQTDPFSFTRDDHVLVVDSLDMVEHLNSGDKGHLVARPPGYEHLPEDMLFIQCGMSGLRTAPPRQFAASFKWSTWNPETNLPRCTHCFGRGLLTKGNGSMVRCDPCEGWGRKVPRDLKIHVV